jgi:hypothetical protein
MKVGDKALGNGEACEILSVDREPKGPVPGRYTVRFQSGMVIQNFPGYQLKSTTPSEESA